MQSVEALFNDRRFELSDISRKAVHRWKDVIMQNRLLSAMLSSMLNGKAASSQQYQRDAWRQKRRSAASINPECHQSRLHYIFRAYNVVRRSDKRHNDIAGPEAFAELFASFSVAARNFFIGAIIFGERAR